MILTLKGDLDYFCVLIGCRPGINDMSLSWWISIFYTIAYLASESLLSVTHCSMHHLPPFYRSGCGATIWIMIKRWERGDSISSSQPSCTTLFSVTAEMMIRLCLTSICQCRTPPNLAPLTRRTRSEEALFTLVAWKLAKLRGSVGVTQKSRDGIFTQQDGAHSWHGCAFIISLDPSFSNDTALNKHRIITASMSHSSPFITEII